LFTNIPIYKTKEAIQDQQAQVNSQDLQLFHVNIRPDELQIILDSNPSLESEQTYILINEASKQIFLWIGSKANVWARFVGACFANTLQRTKGLTYRVISIDEEEETLEFTKNFSLLKPEQ
jgi:hypothetical protein